MKCKKSLLTLLTVASTIGSATLSYSQATSAEPAKPAASAEAPKQNPAHGQPGHVHDENCEHGHDQPRPNVEQVRTFLKNHADYILPEFEKVIKGNDEEHIVWMLNDISKIMSEHAELKAFDSKLASLFIEVFKLENDLYAFIETKLTAGIKPEAAGLAAKPILKALLAKRIELNQGQIAYQKAQLDKEFKELEDASKKIDEITEKELKQIVKELKAEKATNQEPEPEAKPQPKSER